MQAKELHLGGFYTWIWCEAIIYHCRIIDEITISWSSSAQQHDCLPVYGTNFGRILQTTRWAVGSRLKYDFCVSTKIRNHLRSTKFSLVLVTYFSFVDSITIIPSSWMVLLYQYICTRPTVDLTFCGLACSKAILTYTSLIQLREVL